MLRLADLIKQNGLTQKEFARQLNLAPTTVNNYVKGLREPDIKTIEVFCNYFGVTADYLLCRSSAPTASMTDEEAALLRAYRAADEGDRTIVELTLKKYRND